MPRSRLWCLGLLVAALSCERAPAPPPFTAVADVRQLMEAVIEPAADEYWAAVGSVDDSTGTHSFAPRSEAEWIVLRNNAYTVTESGNLLMIGSRARDQDEWIKMSLAMIEAGTRAIKAAEARDTIAVFDRGAELYDTCVSCHAKYYVGDLAPKPK